METVGPFRVLAVLGQGGMGRVLLGVARDGRPVAVKQVHAEFAEDEGFRARFRREVEASRRVSGAYTAAVIAADPDAPTPWLAAQFVPGPTLGEAVAAAGALPEEAVRRLAAGLAQALTDVHRAGLIHRDLKPSNVMLTGDGVRVIDFGIARAAEGQDTRLTRTGAMIGSPGYMAPEQLDGREPTAASDVFALGATLVVAATGRPAFGGESLPSVLFNVLHGEPDLAGVPVALRPIVRACLAKDPAARPTLQDVLATVGRITPSARPWPDPVHRLLAEREAWLVRQLGAAARTPAVAPTPEPVPGPMPAPQPVPEPEPVPAPAPVPAPVPVPTRPATAAAVEPPPRPRRRRGLRVGLALGGIAVVLVSMTGVGPADLQDLLFPEPVPTPGNVPLSQVADKYAVVVPSCTDAQKVKVPAEFSLSAGTVDGGDYERPDKEGKRLENFCWWNTRTGDKLYVSWDTFASVPGGRTGAERAKDRYESLYMGGRTRDESIHYAEEGFWLPERFLRNEHCALYLRDVNITVDVFVDGADYPKGRCGETTKAIGESAVQLAAAVSRNGPAPRPTPTRTKPGTP
ncbi:serine/threonine-protein kinase [Kitasatospora sp. NPDC094028]